MHKQGALSSCALNWRPESCSILAGPHHCLCDRTTHAQPAGPCANYKLLMGFIAREALQIIISSNMERELVCGGTPPLHPLREHMKPAKKKLQN
eukprot:1147694-Pelagomonas_calceolata.AAC.6